jgi:tetratricopeptide (TPR) repeat protein
MGKTNLLLNSKRTLETPDRIFVYIDLSTQFASAAECFRYIIDTIVRTNRDTFAGLKQRIKDNRAVGALSANKEHEMELLALLRCYAGRIIIIMDEIDALTDAAFSDQVFAQIRSVYFARINYSEFDRLTYVLSGVVDPSQLIKDKNRSPFNIGEKIYLDDFTFAEFREFTEKAELQLTARLQEYIYEWVGGHPRMTWDVCSELEDYQLSAQALDIGAVDETIRKLYLTDFNAAPIDSIRKSVQVAPELRAALVTLQSGKSSIGDDLKARLYLLGAVRYSDSSATVTIKNRVLAKSLSMEWLLSEDKTPRNLLRRGVELEHLEEYAEAASKYEEFLLLARDAFDMDTINSVRHSVGFCRFRLGKYEEAITSFEACSVTPETNVELYYRNKLRIGLSYLQLGAYEKSKAFFQHVIQNYHVSIIKAHAMFNFASAIVGESGKEGFQEARQIYRDLLSDTDAIKFADIPDINELRLMALYNLAQMAIEEGDLVAAKAAYDEAIEFNIKEHAPILMFLKAGIEEQGESRKKLLAGAIAGIMQNRIVAAKATNSNTSIGIEDLSLNEGNLTELLTAAFGVVDDDTYVRFLEYCKANIYTTYDSVEKILFELGEAARRAGNSAKAVRIFNTIMLRRSDERDHITLSTFRSLGICKYYLRMKYLPDLQAYVALFEKSNNFDRQPVGDDFLAFVFYIIELRDRKMWLRIVDACHAIERHFAGGDPSARRNYIVIYYYLAVAYYSMRRQRETNRYARIALELIATTEGESASVLDADTVDVVRKQCEEFTRNTNVADPYVREAQSRIGRNDSCPCGSGKKYKKCHALIQSQGPKET